MEWIKIIDRLPEKPCTLLCYFESGDYEVVYYNHRGFYHSDKKNITHWMELPPPPPQF